MKSELSIAIVAALKAGAEILDVYQSEIKVDMKEDRSPLTQADRRAHNVIAATLRNFPDGKNIPLLSEEGKETPYGERRDWDRFWLVDPLDGTKEFIRRNGEFTVNIALIDKGTPVLGVIYVPVKKMMYMGSWNTSSYKLEDVEAAWPGANDGELLEYVMEKLKKGGQLLPLARVQRTYSVVASRSHLSPETATIIEEKRKEYGEVETVSMGSSLKLCLVAEGSADLYPRLAPTMEWDTAAGHAIARYAGCRVYEPESGMELQYNKENLLNPWFIVERESSILT